MRRPNSRFFYDAGQKVVRLANEYLIDAKDKLGKTLSRDLNGVLLGTLTVVPVKCCHKGCANKAAYAHKISDMWLGWCELHQGAQLTLNIALDQYYPEGLEKSA